MHPQIESPLFSLPAELRLEIYHYVGVTHLPIVDPQFREDRQSREAATHSSALLGVGLAATCKRIHYELALRPLYSANTFVFTSPKLATSFFRHLTNDAKDCISSITLDLHHCIDIHNRGGDPAVQLAWFEYLACPTMHYRTQDNNPCSASGCSHLFFDLPHIRHITLDVRGAFDKAISRSEVNNILSFLLRGTCAGSSSISTAVSCRPDLMVTLMPPAAQKVENCWSCRNGIPGEPWEAAWLCNEEKAETCHRMYGKMGRGDALPLVATRSAREAKRRLIDGIDRRGRMDLS